MPDEVPVLITSLFGAHTQRGIVQIKIGEFEQQWASAEARRVGFMLLEAAEAADFDNLIVTWLREKMDMPLEQIAVILRDLRELRSREPSLLAKTWSELLGA